MKKLLLFFIGLLFWSSGSFGQNLSEGFENESPAPPIEWTVYYANPNPPSENLVTHSTDQAYGESLRSFRFSSYTYTYELPYDQYLVSPKLNVTVGDQTLSFYYSSSFYPEVFKVGWSSSGKEIIDFEWSDEIYASKDNFQEYKKIDLLPGTKYVAIHYFSKRLNEQYLYIDQVEGPALDMSGVPNCAVISSPEDGDMEVQVTALLNWASGGGYPTGYKLHFGTDGGGVTPPTNIENGTVQTSPYTPNSLLDYNTTYYWQVVPFNTDGDAMECPIWSFTTCEDATISTFPYSQTFEGWDFPPEGWYVESTPDVWSNGWSASPVAPDNSSAKFSSQSNPIGNTSELITPPFNLSAMPTARLIFKYMNPTGGDFSVLLSTDGGRTYPNTIWSGLTGQADWVEMSANITSYIGSEVRISFKGTSNDGVGDAYIHLDDIIIEEIPADPLFTISPISKDFGIVPAGATSPVQTFTIYNAGWAPLGITSIALSGPNANEFTLSSVTYPINLAYEAFTTVEVSFNPTSNDAKTALLIISDNQGGHHVTLTGNHGKTCENPIPLMFPTGIITGDTEDYGNDYNSSQIAASTDYYTSYLKGFEVVYQFTVDKAGELMGSISSSADHIGVFILKDCPNSDEPPIPFWARTSEYGSAINFEYGDYIPAGTYFLIISNDDVNQGIDYTIDLILEYQGPSESTFVMDGDWSEVNNWEPKELPAAGTHVTINANVTVDVGWAECWDLTITSQGALEITEGWLRVHGDLLIQSDATGTGSFIDFGKCYLLGRNTIERYLTKYNNSGDRMFHFISSPVKSQPIRPEFVSNASPIPGGTDFYSFSETDNLWINTRTDDNNWNTVFEPNFEVGKGYMVAYPEDVTKIFTGKLNSYESYEPLKIICTNTSDKGNGWNLLGNPFPSAIDWDAVTLGDGMDNALYYLI